MSLDRRNLADAALDDLMAEARRLRAHGTGTLVTYSPKVFVPADDALPRRLRLLHVRPAAAARRACVSSPRTRCSRSPGPGRRPAAARRSSRSATGPRRAIAWRATSSQSLGCETTLEYLARCARRVLDETGLLPHLNPGVMSRDELTSLRPVAASMGIMLETTAGAARRARRAALGVPGQGAGPSARDDAARGRARDPVHERDPDRHRRDPGGADRRAPRPARPGGEHGHLREVIVQNFRAKPGTRMADHADAAIEEHLWSIAVARIVLGPDVHVQAPPNLAYDDFPLLLDAGIDDWGGVSPVTVDHVNPEAPWPDVERLREACRSRGLELAPRLPLYPEHVADLDRWADPAVAPAIRRAADAHGLAREDRWAPGEPVAVPFVVAPRPGARRDGGRASSARTSSCGSSPRAGSERERVLAAADRLRREVCGDEVTYVVTRNVQYTNVCYFRCGFCAFSKGKLAANLRGPGLSRSRGGDRPARAARRGSAGRPRCASRAASTRRSRATTTRASFRRSRRPCRGSTSTRSRRSRSGRAPRRSASTSTRTSARLRDLGLGSLPGTAAEILDDEVRAVICPDKVTTEPVARGARRRAPRRAPLERDDHVRPRRAARALGAAPPACAGSSRRRSGGFTEFVPLPFVPMEAPIYLKGRARRGPTFGEALLLHAVARLALHPLITNVQASWVKLGPDGVRQALAAGVNDLGGTLMNESISRAAGSEWGQELPPERDGGTDPLGGPRCRGSGRRPTARRPRSRCAARSGRRRSRSRSTRRCATRASGGPRSCCAPRPSRADAPSRLRPATAGRRTLRRA